MLFKVYYFLRQRKEYRSLVTEFQYSMELRPQNEEEEKYAQIIGQHSFAADDQQFNQFPDILGAP